MYALPTTLPVGLDAFRDLVTIVIDSVPLVIVAVLFFRGRELLIVEFDIWRGHLASFVLAPSTEHFKTGPWGQASECVERVPVILKGVQGMVGVVGIIS